MSDVRARVLVLAAQAGLLGLSVVYLVVPGSALFLERYGARNLPFVYLAVAVLGVAVSRGMGLLQARLSLAGVARCCIGAFVAIVAAAWALLRFGDQPWVSAVLVGLFPLVIPVGFVMVGTQAGRLLDVRSMKRYFARIVAGFSLGFVVGGLTAAALTGPLGGPVNLLLVDAVCGVAYLGTAVAAGRWFPEELARRPEPPAQDPPVPAEEPAPQAGGRLYVVMFGYQLLVAAITQLLDYIVWERAAFHFPDPSDLARFQGLYGTLINIVALGFVFLAAGRLLVRYGERGGLAANPLGVIVLLVLGTVVGLVGGPDGWAFFVVVCAQQVAHIALTDGLTRAAINTAYQALEPRQRLRAQTVVEAAGVPLALGFVGVLLLLFRVTHLGVRAVVVLTLVLSAVWLVTALVAYRHYRAGVLALVTARPWEPRDLAEADSAAVSSLLAGPDVSDVRVGLRAVAPSAATSGAELSDLLTSPDPCVRLAAAAAVVGDEDAVAEQGRDVWLAAVSDHDPVVRDAALAGCAAAPHRFFVPHLVDLIADTASTAALADALDRYAAALAPLVVERLGREPAGVGRERLVAALGRMRDSLPGAPEGLPDLRVEVEVRSARAARARAAQHAVETLPALETLQRALAEDTEHGAETLADHLATRVGQRRVERIVAGLGRSGPEGHALAVELLEVLEGRETGERLAGLLSPPELGGPELASALAEHAVPARSAAEWVVDIVADPESHWDDGWLRACALHAAPEVLGADAVPLARAWTDDPDETVAETARWVVATAGGS